MSAAICIEETSVRIGDAPVRVGDVVSSPPYGEDVIAYLLSRSDFAPAEPPAEPDGEE